MSKSEKTVGQLIADEFSRDKCHLTDAEQRRLASMIDMQIVVGWSEKYTTLIQKHLDECRQYIMDRGIEKERIRCERCGAWDEIAYGEKVTVSEIGECSRRESDGSPCGGTLVREFFEPELRSAEDMRADAPDEAAEYHRLADEAEAVATENQMRQTPVSLGSPPIKTHFVNPPIPFRGADWLAWVDGSEEGPFGRGETESAAINNLNDILEESV